MEVKNLSSPRQRPDQVAERGAYKQEWFYSPHEKLTRIKHSNTEEKNILEGNKILRDLDHRKLEWGRLAARVPDPPTDHYLMCIHKWDLHNPIGPVKRANWIKFLKSSDGAPYRVIDKKKI